MSLTVFRAAADARWRLARRLRQGLFGAIAVLGALVARDRTGRGQAIDVSSQDAMFSLLDQWPSIFAASGRLPRQVGNRHLARALRLVSRQRRLLVIAVASNKLFRQLCQASTGPSSATIRASGVTARLEHGDEINEIVSAWVATHTVEEVMRSSDPTAPASRARRSYTVDELVEHPQLLARDMIPASPRRRSASS